MRYEPQEGIDYIVDLYAVAGVEPDSEPSEIKKAINSLLAKYHPDRLAGLAPEFQARGEQMARLLNKARGILESPENRSQYDEIRTSWTGPLSKSGDPVITVSRANQAELTMKSMGEVEEAFSEGDKQVDTLAGYSHSRLNFLEKMIEAADSNVPDDLRQQYEESLLEYDRNLSIKEAQRGDLLGLPDISNNQYTASLTYGEDISLKLEAAKIVRLAELRSIAMGKTARKLELLSGELSTPSTELVDVTTIQLPGYFDTVAKQVTNIATNRQKILEKRLANFQPDYPESEIQVEAKESAIFGIVQDEKFTWFTFVPDFNKGSFDAVDMPDGVRELLDNKDYKAVIEKGYNVVLLPALDQIKLTELLNEAINKYVDKFYPDEEESDLED